MSSNESTVTNEIVITDTNALISRADSIVNSCTGPNCNTSSATRNKITQELSLLSQEQANTLLKSLTIPPSAEIARAILFAYIELGASVSSVYSFQCGDNPTISMTCVSNATSVKQAQKQLDTVIQEPVANGVNHFAVISILIVIASIAFLFFVFFFLFGLLDSALKPKNQTIKVNANDNYILINDTKVLPTKV